MLKGFKDSISKIFLNRKVDQETLDEFEELLIKSDIDIGTAEKIVEKLSSKRFGDDFTPGDIQSALEEIISEVLAPSEKKIKYNIDQSPLVLMVMGVNGSGKTTTAAKIANNFIKEGKKVLLVAADTFRAAASEQLEEWSKKINTDILKGEEGSDPASIVFKSIEKSKLKEHQVIIIDTAGRLHNNVNLMKELGKIKNVMQKLIPNAPHEVMLVLDASTGQNAIEQATQFTAATEVDSIVLTKLDGTAKGGVVIGISDQFQIPVRYIGVGEGMEDLQHFNKKEFVDSLFN